MTKPVKYSPEVRERAVWMVSEHQGEHESQWAAINAIAPKIGCTAETLRLWVRGVASAIAGCATGRPAPSASASKRWSARCARPTRFCARPRRILLKAELDRRFKP
jgi:transposase